MEGPYSVTGSSVAAGILPSATLLTCSALNWIGSGMSETPKDDAVTPEQGELTDDEVAEASGGNDPVAVMDFSSGDLRSSMTGYRPPPPNPFR